MLNILIRMSNSEFVVTAFTRDCNETEANSPKPLVTSRVFCRDIRQNGAKERVDLDRSMERLHYLGYFDVIVVGFHRYEIIL